MAEKPSNTTAKYITVPQEASEIAKLYEKGKEYNDDIELSDTVEQNRNFYSGKQWEDLNTEGLKPIIINITRPIVQIKAASIMSDDISFIVRPLGIPGATSKNMEREAEIITNELKRIWEKRKGTSKTRKAITNAAVDGDACWHMVWDTSIPVAKVDQELVDSIQPDPAGKENMNGTEDTAGVFGMASTTAEEGGEEQLADIEVEGDIDFETIYNTRVFFGNTADPDVQKQPWILVASREYTAKLKQTAEENGVSGNDLDAIKGASDDYFDDDQEDRTTLFTYYYRDEETGTICVMEATESVIIKEATDTGLHSYPIAWMNWEETMNSYHGTAAVTELVYNNLAVNVLATMAVASVSRSAFPTIIYRRDMIPEYNNGVGAAIGINGYCEDVNNIIKVVEGANYGYQVDKLIQYITDTTSDLNGATDASLGSLNPENTSAIIAAQKAAMTPLELNKQALYQFVEDWCRCAIDFMANYYGIRPVTVRDENGQEQIIEFNFDTINTAAFDIRIDVGGSSYWSEITEVQTLDNLFLKEMITAEEYIEAMPINLLPSKNLLLHKIKARMAQEQGMTGEEQATPQSEMAPMDMSEQNSPIAPTAEDLSGLVPLNDINAVAGKADNGNEL